MLGPISHPSVSANMRLQLVAAALLAAFVAAAPKPQLPDPCSPLGPEWGGCWWDERCLLVCV